MYQKIFNDVDKQMSVDIMRIKEKVEQAKIRFLEYLELARPIRLSENMFPAILGEASNITDRLPF